MTKPVPANIKHLLHYETHQKASNTEWMVLVHGAGGSTRTWKRQVEQLGAEYNLLVIDLPGHGQNAGRKLEGETYTFDYVANKIWEVLDELEISKAHLIGISFGTIVILQMRLMQPERILSLIMPGAIVKLNFKLRILASVSLASAKIIGYHNFYKMSALVMMPRGNHKKSRDVFIKESKILTTGEFKNWTNLYFHLNKKLNHIFKIPSTIPHLLVMGSQDHLFLPPAKVYADLHDNATISIIPKCGHVVSIEQASQFNKICLSFLKKIK